MATKRRGHFGRFNALVDGGWLKVLTRNEISMWHAYEKFADPEGIAYPSGEEVARIIGHSSPTHVPDLRRRLVNYGLLAVETVGGGSGNICTVRVLLPGKAPAKKHSRNRSKNIPDSGNVSADKHSRFEHENIPDFGIA